MPKMKFLHNPRCSKSRQALKILQEREIAVDIIEYLKTPLPLNEIERIYKLLGLETPLDMMRVKEKEFAQAGLTKSSAPTDLLQAMADYPKLIERPILYNDVKAVIGRPPENVENLL